MEEKKKKTKGKIAEGKKSAHLMEIGEEFEPLEFVVTPELNQQYLFAEEDFNPRYIEKSEFGPPLVHPGLLLNMSNNTRSPSFYLPSGWGEVHAGEETEYLNPPFVGKKFKVTWKVINAFEKRGRPWNVLDILIEDEDGLPIMRRKMINTFTFKELKGRRKRRRIIKDTSIGQDFNGRPKKMSWERIWAFSGGAFTSEGWPRKNLHTDTEFAKNLGLPTVGVSATQYLGHLAELMLNLFGEGWLRGGKMTDLKFVKLVANGDILTSKAKVIAKDEESSGVRYTLEICCENQQGEKVLIGRAIGIAPL